MQQYLTCESNSVNQSSPLADICQVGIGVSLGLQDCQRIDLESTMKQLCVRRMRRNRNE